MSKSRGVRCNDRDEYVHYCQAYNLLQFTLSTSAAFTSLECVLLTRVARVELTRAVIHVHKTQIWNRHFCSLNKLRGTQRYLRTIMRFVNMKAS